MKIINAFVNLDKPLHGGAPKSLEFYSTYAIDEKGFTSVLKYSSIDGFVQVGWVEDRSEVEDFPDDPDSAIYRLAEYSPIVHGQIFQNLRTHANLLNEYFEIHENLEISKN